MCNTVYRTRTQYYAGERVKECHKHYFEVRAYKKNIIQGQTGPGVALASKITNSFVSQKDCRWTRQDSQPTNGTADLQIATLLGSLMFDGRLIGWCDVLLHYSTFRTWEFLKLSPQGGQYERPTCMYYPVDICTAEHTSCGRS